MTSRCQPVIGDWFQKPSGELFEVVAIDQQEGTIDVQYFTGDIDEFDDESWFAMEITTADAPEDISGAFDSPDDGASAPASFDDVLDQIDRDL
jgi:hypothetical protein